MYFFFSSRRRHTRWPRDWSSDVCSSDLYALIVNRTELAYEGRSPYWEHGKKPYVVASYSPMPNEFYGMRSEERRVGKECSCRWIESPMKTAAEATSGHESVASKQGSEAD